MSLIRKIINKLPTFQYKEVGIENYIEEAKSIGYHKTMKVLPYGTACTVLVVLVLYMRNLELGKNFATYIFFLYLFVTLLWLVFVVLDQKKTSFTNLRKSMHGIFAFFDSFLIGWLGFHAYLETSGIERATILMSLAVLISFSSLSMYATPWIIYMWTIGLSVYSVGIFIVDGTYNRLIILFFFLLMMGFFVFTNRSIYNDFIRQYVFKAKAGDEYEEKISFQKNHDISTGLFNRNYLDRRMTNLKGFERGLLLLIEITNDSDIILLIGYQKRTELIKEVFRRLENTDPSIYFKVGSSTYAFLNTESDLNPEEYVATIQRRIEEIDYLGFDLELQFRMGARVFREQELSEKIYEQAHVALYSCNEDMGEKWKIYNESLEEEIINKLTLVTDIDLAMKYNHFVMYYQPQVDAITKKIVSYEALIRWKHPSKGFISPSEFIPLAEESGKVVPLGYWIIRTACKEALSWNEPLPISINIAARQIHEPDFVERVVDIVEEINFPWERITFEITESVYIGDDYVVDRLCELSGMGANISLDDFGTGYSSLSYLTRLPLDELKIDKYFVWNIEEGINLVILEMVMGIAKRFDLNVVAEGIENEEQAERLRYLGCNKLQGYLYSKPLPAEKLN